LKQLFVLSFALSFSLSLFAQGRALPSFEVDATCYSSPIKSQGRTGTCWSFSTSSFLESEYQKKTGKEIDLSEMFTVRHIYVEKAQKYLRYHGLSNFSQGSLGHDVIRSYNQYGIVPESVYSGLKRDSIHNHSVMEAELKRYLDSLLRNKPIHPEWKRGFDAILDRHIGTPPEMFEYQGVLYNPKSFADKYVNLDDEKYIGLTSFIHHEKYSKFTVEVPDNFSDGQYFNVELNELIRAMDNALEMGYTVEWDGDVSERGFNTRFGVAVWNNDSAALSMLPAIPEEKEVNAELRQALFDSHKTTDDHLMHIVGIAHSPDGRKFYITKNSWGTRAGINGFMYMSEDYVKMKTICIMINQKALPKNLSNRLTIQ